VSSPRPLDDLRTVALRRDDLSSFHLRRLRSFTYPGRGDRRSEAVHRHDFHELIWIESGAGRQNIDGVVCRIRGHTVYVIARGQAHQFIEARNVTGLVVRFTEDFLPAPAAGASLPALFDALESPRSVTLRGLQLVRVRGLLGQVRSEYQQPEPRGKSLVLGHLLRALIVDLDRAVRPRRDPPGDGEPGPSTVCRDFLELLERQYRARHDVAFYARALRLPSRLLSGHVKQARGRTAKQVIEARLIVEAKRYLRFTTLPVKAVAYELGYEDPSYFCKVFRRLTGASPHGFRAAQRSRLW
jgi:AraC family transcriptional regulator, transcriptional activator of pobA